MNDIEAKIQETIQRQQAEDRAGREASAVVLPGALRNAFKLQPGISVNKYNVRAITDGDVELMAQINHPIAEMILEGMKGGEMDEKKIPLRGSTAWIAIWIFTHTRKEVKEMLKTEGLQGLSSAAEDEFSEYQLGALYELITAVVQQIGNYFSTILQPVAAAKEGEEAKAQANPISSAPPLTGSGG